MTWHRRLGDVTGSRDNAFDAIRLLAAVAVMWGHSFFEAPSSVDPLLGLMHGDDYEGSLAVYAFFLLSGLLVSGSLERHGPSWSFVAARVARVWPGLLACTAVMTLLVAPLCSGASPFEPHRFHAALDCTARNLAFPVVGPCSDLAGAFPSTPMPGTFGYTFWTLPLEVHCYCVSLLVGLVASRLPATWRGTAWCLCTGAATLAYLVMTRTSPGGWIAPEFALVGGYSTYPVLFFAAGMVAHAFRDRIALDLRSAAVALTAAPWLPHPVALAAFGYGVLCLGALRPPRWLRPRSDLSYGTYLYGAGVQQAVTQLVAPGTATAGLALALPVTLACAWASWTWVEAPALRLSRRVTRGWSVPRRTVPAAGVTAT